MVLVHSIKYTENIGSEEAFNFGRDLCWNLIWEAMAGRALLICTILYYTSQTQVINTVVEC